MAGSLPCESWPVAWPQNCTELDTASPITTGTAVASATQVLWGLSGRQFGTCELTLRPCRRECLDGTPWVDVPPWSDGWPQPALVGGLWFNLTCGTCAGSCSCSRVSEVLLPAPVVSVTEVVVDGTPVVSGAYRLDDARLLVRQDGGEWPRCNDLSRPAGEVDTWTVTAVFGKEVPALAELAMGELACQFLRGMTGQECRLPAGVTQLARQGVTISFPDVNELFEAGLTGFTLTDLFIKTFNPGGLRRRSRAYSVDRPSARRTGT